MGLGAKLADAATAGLTGAVTGGIGSIISGGLGLLGGLFKKNNNGLKNQLFYLLNQMFYQKIYFFHLHHILKVHLFVKIN